MKKTLAFLAMALFAAVVCQPARAGNITLTGHDDDYHCSFEGTTSSACLQLTALVNFAKAGSTLPVLTFDAGTELTSDLTKLGISYVNINPNVAATVTAALFNNSIYSAFIVASDTTCGGCDNNASGEANIAAQSAAINNFLNNGGGIVGLAGAFSSNYYAFVPQTATSVGGAPSTGYSQTAVGASFGINAVNGDATHNLFYNPGTNGESSFYQVAETNASGNGTVMAPAATTLLCYNCSVSGGVIVSPTVTPEPSSFVLLGSGLLSVAGVVRRRMRLK